MTVAMYMTHSGIDVPLGSPWYHDPNLHDEYNRTVALHYSFRGYTPGP